MTLENIRSYLKNKAFLKNVVVLASGTILGQAIIFLFMPLLTRLYSPEDFGALGVYVSLIVVLSVAACLRFDIAIPLPEKDAEAANLLILAAGSATVLGAILAAAVFLWSDELTQSLGRPVLRPYLWMIPTGVWLAATYSALQYWSIRQRRFVDVSKTQLSRAIGSSCTQVASGLYYPSPFGLLFGYMLYCGLGAWGLLRKFWRHDRHLVRTVSQLTLIAGLKKWRRYPLYSTGEALLDSAANNLPLVMISIMCSAKEAGYLLLAQRVISIPIGLFGSSLSRAYLSAAGERMRLGTLKEFTYKIMRTLFGLGIIPFILLMMLAPTLAVYIFGSEWERAGVMVAWLAPAMFLQFLASPVSTIFNVTASERIVFVFKLIGFFVLIVPIFISNKYWPGLEFENFAVASIVYYVMFFVMIVFVSNKNSGM